MSIKIKSPTDVESANQIIQLGWPKAKPYLDEIVWWCIEPNWPVAQELIPFCISLGVNVVPAFKQLLHDLLERNHYEEVRGLLAFIASEWDKNIIAQIQDDLRFIASLNVESPFLEAYTECAHEANTLLSKLA